MRRYTVLLAVVVAAGLALFGAQPAQAQAIRTWVSGVGDDVNPCSRTAPCKTFAGAISKTAAGGEISVLDSAGFGAVTITKSISIVAEGAEGGITSAGTTGIIVNAGPADVVRIRGLIIEGGGSAVLGLNGIRVLAGGALHIEDCVLDTFRAGVPNGNGILIANSAGTFELDVVDTAISGSVRFGIDVSPTGAGGARVMLEDVQVSDSGHGIRIDASGTTGKIFMAVHDSYVIGSSGQGFVAKSAGSPAQMLIDLSSAIGNNTGILATGAGARVRLGASVITGNTTGVEATDGGVVASYGDNRIDGNTTNGTASPVAPQ